MRILFHMGHPADLHLFRNAMSELSKRGHHVAVTAVAKEQLTQLIEAYGFEYQLVGKNTPTLAGKALTMIPKDIAFLKRARAWHPQLVISMCSAYAAHASAVMNVPHIGFNDTEIADLTMRITLPFSDAVCTPSCFEGSLGPKQIRFNGYKELAYLHPNRYQPNPAVLEQVGATERDTLIVIRFGVINASHDLHYHGLNLNTDRDKSRFVKALEEYGRVFVTSESPLGTELRERVPAIPSSALHDLLYYASLYIGDGATMASEAGVLGTPWVYVSDSSRGYLNDQERRYKLGFREPTVESALSRAKGLLELQNLKSEWRERRKRMLAEKVDVTTFMIELIEGWPSSFSRAKARELGPQIL